MLDGIATEVMRGEVCVMLGPSGSGKSTFLNLIGGLEGADGGTVSVGGCELTALGSGSWASTAGASWALSSSSTTS